VSWGKVHATCFLAVSEYRFREHKRLPTTNTITFHSPCIIVCLPSSTSQHSLGTTRVAQIGKSGYFRELAQARIHVYSMSPHNTAISRQSRNPISPNQPALQVITQPQSHLSSTRAGSKAPTYHHSINPLLRTTADSHSLPLLPASLTPFTRLLIPYPLTPSLLHGVVINCLHLPHFITHHQPQSSYST